METFRSPDWLMKILRPTILYSLILEPNFSEQNEAAYFASLIDVNLKFIIFPTIFKL